AIEFYNRALESNPEHVEAWHNKGITLGSGNYKNVLVRIKSDFSDSDVKKVAEIIIEGVGNGSKKGCGGIRGEV
ncbi:hypothetical protein B6U96_10995, partial [Archaeoglobales archaeon ex4484_92]